MFLEAIDAILSAHAVEAVRSAEAGHGAHELYAALEEGGFFDLLAAEEEGGAGLQMSEFYPIVMLFGATALPLPIASTMVARLLLAPLDRPSGTITFAPALTSSHPGNVTASLVPFAMTADYVLGAHQDAFLLLPVAQAVRVPTGVRGSMTASLSWAAGQARAVRPLVSVDMQALGAVLHAGLIAGASKRVFDMTLQYGNDRSQFGKSIGKFQAIQHQLSVMAEHVAATLIAAESAFQCGRRVPSVLASAVAKSRTSEAAQLTASTAHAIHGAIGITAEYELQRYTRRLHEWRLAHGSESYWNSVLGQQVLASPHALLTDFVRTVLA
jgi:hypothetical protein